MRVTTSKLSPGQIIESGKILFEQALKTKENLEKKGLKNVCVLEVTKEERELLGDYLMLKSGIDVRYEEFKLTYFEGLSIMEIE